MSGQIGRNEFGLHLFLTNGSRTLNRDHESILLFLEPPEDIVVAVNHCPGDVDDVLRCSRPRLIKLATFASSSTKSIRIGWFYSDEP
jgi:hypothetical protein